MQTHPTISRRQLLQSTACGFGSLALSGLVDCGNDESKTAEDGGTKPDAKSYPVIQLDDEHNQAAGRSRKYELAPTQGIVVSADGYRIPVSEKFSEKLKVSGPNCVNIIHGPQDYFRAEWDGTGRLTLDADALTNIKGSTRFTGFTAGERYVVGIGHDNYPATEVKLKFSVMWLGMIEVK